MAVPAGVEFLHDLLSNAALEALGLGLEAQGDASSIENAEAPASSELFDGIARWHHWSPDNPGMCRCGAEMDHTHLLSVGATAGIALYQKMLVLAADEDPEAAKYIFSDDGIDGMCLQIINSLTEISGEEWEDDDDEYYEDPTPARAY